MSNEQKFIEEIEEKAIKFKNDKDYREKYEEYENMKQTLSDTLYSKNSHFIYELIQNAEDNIYSKDVEASLKFIISDGGILTQNNEIGFNEENIKSICKFSSSSKKGKKELGFIGEKGLGFKSVFGITDKPIIVSNGYQFFFKTGEYTIPYWVEDNNLLDYPKELFDLNTTNIYLPFKENFSYKEDIQQKVKDIEPIVLLFLKKLHRIQIIQGKGDSINVEKKSLKNINNFTETILKYEDIEDTFYVITKIVDRPNELEEPKRDKVKKREITLVFPDFNNKIQDDRIFAFLPTETRTNLDFMIQGDFLLTGNRESILEHNKWNQWLIKEVEDFFVEVFPCLQKVYPYEYLKYFTPKLNGSGFIKRLYDRILDRLRDEKLFLTRDNEFVVVDNVCILDDYDFMIEYIDDIKYNKFYVHQNFYIPKHLEEKWKIERLDKKVFLDLLSNNSNDLKEKFKNNHLLFENLIDYIEKNRLNYLDSSLKKLPLIPLDINDRIEFRSKIDLGNSLIFYKLDDEGFFNNLFKNIKCISKIFYKKLEGIQFYSAIFSVKQPDILELLNGLNKSILCNRDINIKLLVYIKNNFGMNKILTSLKENYMFYTKNNQFISYDKLYISNSYWEEDNCIELIVDKYCSQKHSEYFDFISIDYLEYELSSTNKDEAKLKKEWKDFFYSIEIADDIKLIKEHLHKNIPFIKNMSFDTFSKKDSIFLFKRLITLKSIDKNMPWIKFIKNDFPIFFNDTEYQRIGKLYQKVDKKLANFFQKIPNEYPKNNQVLEVFNLQEEPIKKDIIKLITSKKIDNFDNIKSIFRYLQQYENISIPEIPILEDTEVKYIKKGKLVWEKGQELNLIEVKAFYGKSKLKSFFIDILDVKETPSVEQFIEFLKTKPTNYKKTFNQFLQKMKNELEEGRKPNIYFDNLKLCLINSKHYSFNEIIFNDENIKTNKINNLLSVSTAYKPALEKVVEAYSLKKISNYEKKIITRNIEESKDIYNIYIRLLIFVWDYIYSSNRTLFDKLMSNRNLIIETKNVEQGAKANIVLKIDLDSSYVELEEEIVIDNNKICLLKSIDEREVINKISKFISKKVQVEYSILELFYEKVYKHKDYSKDEYYKKEQIIEPNDGEKFDDIFSKIIEKEIVEENEDEEEIDLPNEFQPLEVNTPKKVELKESLEKLEEEKQKLGADQVKDYDKNILNTQNETSPLNLKNIQEYRNKYIKSKKEKLQRISSTSKELSKRTKNTISTSKYREGEEDTKEFFKKKEQYLGQCQICGFTFTTAHGNYCERFTWSDDTRIEVKADLIDAGNSLCLCAKCHSIIKGGGDFESSFLTDEVMKKLKEEGYEFDTFLDDIDSNKLLNIPECFNEHIDFYDMYFVDIRLNNNEERIYFTEEHLVMFFEFLKS